MDTLLVNMPTHSSLLIHPSHLSHRPADRLLDLAMQLQRSIIDVMTTPHPHPHESTSSPLLHDPHPSDTPSPSDKLDVLLDVVRDLQSELRGVRALAQEQTGLLQVRYSFD